MDDDAAHTETFKAALRVPITYPRDAIVDTAHVAAALGVSDEIVGRMDLPCFYAGKRPRYIWAKFSTP